MTAATAGGAGGLGRAFTEYWLSKGKSVVIAGRTTANLEKTAKEIASPKLSYLTQDFTKID